MTRVILQQQRLGALEGEKLAAAVDPRRACVQPAACLTVGAPARVR